MSLRMAILLSLIFLLMIPGASGTKWIVKYNTADICALKGSTVYISGSYTYPKHLVTEEFWIIDPVKDVEPPALCSGTMDSGRIQCSVYNQQHFSLRLSDLRKKDEHKYQFRIKSNVSTQIFLGDPVKISVTDLRVNSPPKVTEKESAVLTCTTTCSLTHSPTFIWYKNGHPLSSSTKQLHLQSVSSEDAGSYSCAVQGYEHLPSPAVTLTFRYPPKNVSVSISPSGEIVEGSSVTLTCSSDANPPVQNYTWIKDGGTSPVGSGQSYTIINITAEHTGLYYCVAQNEHGALNGTVTITVKGGQSLSAVWTVVGGGTFLLLTIIICIYIRRKYQNRLKNETDHQNNDPDTQDDTYTVLHPSSRCSDDVYHTLTTVHPGSPDNTSTALDPHCRSPDNTSTALDLHCRSPDNTSTALDPHSSSPVYENVATLSSRL